MKSNPNLFGIVAIGLWSTSALIVSQTGNIPPMLLSAITSLCGFIICLIYWKYQKENIINKFNISFSAYAIGIFGICGYTSTWLIGLKLAPPFEANSLNYMWPLLLVLFVAKLEKSTLSFLQIIGLFLGLVGSIMIFLRHYSVNNNELYLLGLLSALSGAIIWATYSSLTKIIKYESDSVGVFLLVTSVITFILHLCFESQNYITVTLSNIMMIFLLGCSRVSFIFWDYAMKNGDQRMLASIAYLVPVISTTLLAIFTPVSWTISITIGAVLILSGCIISNWNKIFSSKI